MTARTPARRAHDGLVGEVLAGRYRVVRMLGKGGMGAVYEARQVDLDRRVALKVLHPFLGEDAEHVERFRREARAAASLGHPNVVQVTDFHSAPGELAFLVMEYLEGRSLRELMRAEGQLEVARALPVVLQVLSALGAAHEAGIVHRDLKPGNVFLYRVEGVGEIAKLLDFGIAKMTEGTGYTMLTRTGVTLGTPVYMAPEQVTGREVDGRTDLYAVGVMAYRALGGSPPFRSRDLGELLRQILVEPAPPLGRLRPDLDEGLGEVFDRAISKLPDERFASASEMAEALLPWLPGRTFEPRAPAPPAPARTAAEADRAELETALARARSEPARGGLETARTLPAPEADRDRPEDSTCPDLAPPIAAARAGLALLEREPPRPGPPRTEELTTRVSTPRPLPVTSTTPLVVASRAVSRTTKIVLIVVGSFLGLALLGGLACVVAGALWFGQNAEGIGERGNEARSDGIAMGEVVDTDACVDLALVRGQGCGRFDPFCQANVSLFLQGCLSRARRSAAFCQGVPSPFDIMQSGNWALVNCQRRGMPQNQACISLSSEIQVYCHQPGGVVPPPSAGEP